MKNWLTRLACKTVSLPTAAEDSADSKGLPLLSRGCGQAEVPNSQLIIDGLHQSCQRQLDILYQALNLTTAALLWVGKRTDQFTLYACSSHSENLNYTPFPLGAGVTGGLKENDELLLAPVRKTSPAIPYYLDNRNVGSFMAMRLCIPDDDCCQGNGLGILCVDREEITAWSEAEYSLVKLTVDQLFTLVTAARQQYVSDRARHAYQRAFDGVRKLNQSLGLASVFASAAEAIRSVVPADFIAISLAEEDRHRVAYVEGEKGEQLSGQQFPIEQGVVGQVLKYARTLPENADYHGTSPVFSDAHLFADYRSLMVVPLCQEDGPTVGALIVAAQQAAMFSRTCREMLELVAAQIAIKIDLANAHELINRMATTDALTGIANRRAYQRGFESMLDRAKRRSGSLYLVLCDIDHFKRINDGYGHPAGDEVLRQVAKLFERVVRSVDLAARTGGEEFAILLEDTDEDGAWKVAERMRKLVEELELLFLGKRVLVNISLGVAAYPQDANNMEQLVSCADKALYHAKESGRNRSVLWRTIS